MKKIKLIACDLDGTLLQNGAQKCDPDLFPLVEALADQGVYFVPASGRQYHSLLRLFDPVKDKLMYLCENGSLVMYQDRVVHKQMFEQALALQICQAVYAHPACEVLISGERVSYLMPKDPGFAPFIRDEVGNQIQLVQSLDEIREPIIKVSYFTKAEDQKAATDYFQDIFKDQCLIVTSGNRWVDFAPLGTSKGSALKEIGQKFGIEPEEMAAFGDNENDRAMLEYVGSPYLMENSNPTIFDIPGRRCRRVEDTLREMLA